MIRRRHVILSFAFLNGVAILSLVLPGLIAFGFDLVSVAFAAGYVLAIAAIAHVSVRAAKFVHERLGDQSPVNFGDIAMVMSLGLLTFAFAAILRELWNWGMFVADQKAARYIELTGDFLFAQATLIFAYLLIAAASDLYRMQKGTKGSRGQYYGVVGGSLITVLVLTIGTDWMDRSFQRLASTFFELQGTLYGLELRIPALPKEQIASVIELPEQTLDMDGTTAFIQCLASTRPRAIVLLTEMDSWIRDSKARELGARLRTAGIQTPVIIELDQTEFWEEERSTTGAISANVGFALPFAMGRGYRRDAYPFRHERTKNDVVDVLSTTLMLGPSFESGPTEQTRVIPYRGPVVPEKGVRLYPLRFRFSVSPAEANEFGRLRAEQAASYRYLVDPVTRRMVREIWDLDRGWSTYRMASEADTTDSPGLTGRILLVQCGRSIPGNQQSPVLRSDIAALVLQSLAENSGIVEVDVWVVAIFAILFILALLWSYGALGGWKGLGVTFLCVTFVCVAAALLFYAGDILFNIMPMLIGSVCVTAFAFPYEVSNERRRFLFETMRLSAELRAAQDMQMGLMPKADPVIPGFEVAAVCIPAYEVGGDFYDYVWLDAKKTKLGIAVADVSGKAMQAAMTAVMTSGLLYSETQKSDSPRKILRSMNHPLYLRSDRRMFTAMGFAVIDVRRKTLTYASAGQVKPIRLRNARADELSVKGTRLPLGVQDELSYRDATMTLRERDVLVFYTDGIVEAMNTNKDMYGFERLMRDLERWHDFPAAAIRDRLMGEIKTFVGDAPQHDDMTVVVVRVK